MHSLSSFLIYSEMMILRNTLLCNNVTYSKNDDEGTHKELLPKYL